MTSWRDGSSGEVRGDVGEKAKRTRSTSRTAICLLFLLLSLSIGCSKPLRTKKTPAPASIKPPPRIVEIPPQATKAVPLQRHHDEKRLSLRVVRISDGDTLTGIDAGKSQTKIRLAGIDAPESDQPFGQASKQALSEEVFGKDVVVVVKDIDRYGRTVGHIFVDGRDVNLEMLEAGMAWHLHALRQEPGIPSGRAVGTSSQERFVG